MSQSLFENVRISRQLSGLSRRGVNMLCDLEQLQNGTLDSKSFVGRQTSRRLFRLAMSYRRGFESVHTGAVNTLDHEQVENRFLLSGDNHGNIGIHDLSKLTKSWSSKSSAIRKVHSNSSYTHRSGVDTVQWYPFDTGMFTTSSMDESVKVWDTRLMVPVEAISLRGKVYNHHLSTVATQHCLIAVATNCANIMLIDMKTGYRSHELRGHRNVNLAVRWSPSAEFLLASAGKDNKILLWDIRSAKSYLSCLDQHNGEQLTYIKRTVTAHNGTVNGLCFSSDGLYLLSLGTDECLRLWDVASGKNTLVNYGKVANSSMKHVKIDLCYKNATIPVVFVPSKNRIQVYDMFRGLRVASLTGHYNEVRCCGYRNYYQELYSGGMDCNLVLWTPDAKLELLPEGYDVHNDKMQQDNWSD